MHQGTDLNLGQHFLLIINNIITIIVNKLCCLKYRIFVKREQCLKSKTKGPDLTKAVRHEKRPWEGGGGGIKSP